MKRVLALFISLGLFVACDWIVDSDSPGNGSNNSGGNSGSGHVDDDDPSSGDNSFGGVVQPKGALKSYHHETIDARGDKTREETDVYTYDAKGRVVRIDSNQKMYDKGVLVNKDPEDQNFVWLYVYNGSDFEFHNDYAESPKTQWGKLNGDSYLTEMNTASYKLTLSYTSGKQLSTWRRVYNDNSKDDKIVLNWDANGNILSSQRIIKYYNSDDAVEANYIFSYSRTPANSSLGRSMDVSYLCFPDFGLGMLKGRGTANFPLHISIVPSEKANLAKLKYYFTYTMSSDGTVLEKMDRYTVEFPFALGETDPTLQQVLMNEVTKDSYTFEYYK